MSKRIILFSHNSNLSGAPISISQLARKLPELGYSPLLILPKHGDLEQKLVEWGVEYRVLKNDFSPLEFVRIIRLERPVLVHVNSLVKTWPVLVSRFMGIPTLWHVREHLGSKRFYARIIHALASRVVLISKNQYRLFDGMKKAVLVFNGVDPGDFNGVQPADVMASAGDSHITVTYIGSVERRKGLTTLVRAAALIKTNVPVQFIIVGNTPDGSSAYREEIDGLITGNDMGNQFHFLGPRADIPAILAGSDVLCHPAFIEEFGRVILEAMASGIPVIASRIGEIKEMVEDDVTGILVEAGNSEQLAAALARLCKDSKLRGRMGENGLTRLKRHYSMNIHAENIVKVYESLLHETSQDSSEERSGVHR